MMIALEIIGFIILSIVSLIFLALCVKVRIFAEYSEIDTKVQLQWLFVKIPIYPLEKKEKKPVEEKAENSEEKKEEIPEEKTEDVTEGTEEEIKEEPVSEEEGLEKPVKKENAGLTLLKEIYNSQGVDGLISIAKRTVNYIGTFVGRIMKTLVIDEFYVDVKCAKSDAAETAIYYGEVCSILFPLLGSLVSKLKVRKYDINVYPDYLARHSSASFAVNIHLYPIYVISITCILLFRLLFNVLLGFIVKLGIQLGKSSKNNSVQKSDNNQSVENKI